MTNVKINTIAPPPHYVRGKISAKNIADLTDVAVKSHIHLFKDQKNPDWRELKGKKLTWPFSEPIEVAINKGGKKEGEKIKPYEIIDGMHRWTIWKRLKQVEIPIKPSMLVDPKQRFLKQYQTNISHGLRLDKDSRDNAIKIAHTIYKVSLTELTKETGLSRASVARILASKQRKVGPRKKSEPKDIKTAPSTQVEMSATNFIDRVQMLIFNYPRLEKEIDDFLRQNLKESGKSKLGIVVSTLKKITETFAVHLKKTEVLPKVNEESIKNVG